MALISKWGVGTPLATGLNRLVQELIQGVEGCPLDVSSCLWPMDRQYKTIIHCMVLPRSQALKEVAERGRKREGEGGRGRGRERERERERSEREGEREREGEGAVKLCLESSLSEDLAAYTAAGYWRKNYVTSCRGGGTRDDLGEGRNKKWAT